MPPSHDSGLDPPLFCTWTHSAQRRLKHKSSAMIAPLLIYSKPLPTTTLQSSGQDEYWPTILPTYVVTWRPIDNLRMPSFFWIFSLIECRQSWILVFGSLLHCRPPTLARLMDIHWMKRWTKLSQVRSCAARKFLELMHQSTFTLGLL